MIDYADSKYIAHWTHHPIFGDASFDSFQRRPDNPVCIGNPDYMWPVNGSLFKDPVSGNWFLYTGWYHRMYEVIEDKPFQCRVYRSEDEGCTWKYRGCPIAGMGTHCFDNEVHPMWGAPDAAVCYKDGKYYMSFDWYTRIIDWEHLSKPETNSGAACAVSDSPEGPFQPICAHLTTQEMTPLLGKYKRVYASTIIPREHDWIALTASDSLEYYGWALLGQSAPKPEGPWSKPKLLLHPQVDYYYPQLIECLPQFVYNGYVYAPGTSAANNRNYQVVFRAPIEEAMNPDSWSIYQDGSVWHSEPVEHEYEGLWGQTLSGFVDGDGIFNVVFPSRNTKNEGTINLARRPWNKPLREQGFVVSGHVSPSMVVMRHDRELTRLEAKLRIYGTAQIMWNHHAPFGPDHPKANCGLHPLMRTGYDALEISESAWALVRYDKVGKRTDIAVGRLVDSHERAIDLQMNGKDISVNLDGKTCWDGSFETAKGRIGLWVEPHSIVEVETFTVDGDISETAMHFLYTEGLVCAAQNLKDWQEIESNEFRYGVGAVSKPGAEEVKWNFTGEGFAIWAPTGPTYGKGELLLDGNSLEVIDFNASRTSSSHMLYQKRGLPHERHSVKLKVIEGSVPVDILEAFLR